MILLKVGNVCALGCKCLYSSSLLLLVHLGVNVCYQGWTFSLQRVKDFITIVEMFVHKGKTFYPLGLNCL